MDEEDFLFDATRRDVSSCRLPLPSFHSIELKSNNIKRKRRTNVICYIWNVTVHVHRPYNKQKRLTRHDVILWQIWKPVPLTFIYSESNSITLFTNSRNLIFCWWITTSTTELTSKYQMYMSSICNQYLYLKQLFLLDLIRLIHSLSHMSFI